MTPGRALATASVALVAAAAWAVSAGASSVSVGRPQQVVVADRGGPARKITKGPKAHQSPEWAPDGERLAIGSEDGVQVVKRDGTVLHSFGRGFEPAWSPGGGRIAFTDSSDAEDFRLVSVHPDGSSRRVLAHTARTPAWTPDGRRLFYLRGPRQLDWYAPGVRRAVWRVDADGGGARKVVSKVYEFRGVSTNGRWILFSRSERERTVGVWIARVDGSGARRLFGENENDLWPEYGWATGSRVYHLDDGLIVVSPSGESHELNDEVGGTDVAWTRDGKWIAWVNQRERVYYSHPDGTDRRQLVDLVATDAFDLTWSPNGKHLAFEGIGGID